MFKLPYVVLCPFRLLGSGVFKLLTIKERFEVYQPLSEPVKLFPATSQHVVYKFECRMIGV